jgi:hypothetical protein
VSITDHAGDTILGRHPEHGFLIDGDIQRDTAEVLFQHGFQCDDNGVLVLPADLDEAHARDRIARAAQVLALSGHNVSVLSDQQAAELAGVALRMNEAQAALTDSQARLLALIRSVHPAPGCLPVPQLRVPTTLEAFDDDRAALADNLFTERGHNAPRWLAARSACPHLPADTVTAIFDLIYNWYQYLSVASIHIVDGCKGSPYNLVWAVKRLDRAMTAMPAAPERELVIQSATAAELEHGDEFSLDDGQTWYVCCRGALGGTVAVYTGEHDHANAWPLTARIDAADDQRCLVRTTA